MTNGLSFSVIDIMLQSPPNPDATIELSKLDLARWANFGFERAHTWFVHNLESISGSADMLIIE